MSHNQKEATGRENITSNSMLSKLTYYFGKQRFNGNTQHPVKFIQIKKQTVTLVQLNNNNKQH